MNNGMKVTICSALFIFGTFVLTGCERAHPIYEARNHMLPPAASAYSLEQVEGRIIKAAKSKSWHVSRIGPGALRATIKWGGGGDKHVAVVKIEYDRKSFNILHERSQNLLEGIAPPEHMYEGQKVIHRRRNDRVHELESAIDQELYGPS